uniref:LYR motif containing 1 n=1 Tax=Canis lupus familiaris TaxID=9615 RepID=A0A8I3N2T4_CANLF
MHWEPDVGFDPGSPGSRPGPKAGAKPLRHPGNPRKGNLMKKSSVRMTTATRQEVLGLYRRIFRLVRKWQAASGQMEDTIKEKQYILNEARTLFQKNKNIHLPPMGLTPLRGRGLRSQEKLRKFSKPVYLKSHDEIS